MARGMRGGATFGWLFVIAGVAGCAIHIGRKDPEPEPTPYLPPDPPATTAATVAKVSTTSTATTSSTSHPTLQPTTQPTTQPTPRPTASPRPTTEPTTAPSSTPSSAPSSAPAQGGWTLAGGTGKALANGSCSGCRGNCGEGAEDGGQSENWSAYFSEGKLIGFTFGIYGPAEPTEMSRDDLTEDARDGGTMTFKLPKDPPNGEVKLHVVGDQAEVRMGTDLLVGNCVWDAPFSPDE